MSQEVERVKAMDAKLAQLDLGGLVELTDDHAKCLIPPSFGSSYAASKISDSRPAEIGPRCHRGHQSVQSLNTLQTEPCCRFVVKGSTGRPYNVTLSKERFTCQCPDHRTRKHNCKHIRCACTGQFLVAEWYQTELRRAGWCWFSWRLQILRTSGTR